MDALSQYQKTLSDYQKLSKAFMEINLVFIIAAGPLDATDVIYRLKPSLYDPWIYPRRVRAKIVSHPECIEKSFPGAVEDIITKLRNGEEVIMHKWDRRNTEDVEKLTYTWNEENGKFNPPMSEQIDLGEHK